MWFLLLGVVALTSTLSFDEALERAADASAVRSATSARTERAREAHGMGNLTENPVLQVQPGWRDIRSGSHGPEVYVSVSQRVRLTQQGSKRKAAVQGELAYDAADAAAALREARLSIAEAWLARWSAQRIVTTAREEAALASSLASRMEATRAAGEATRIDVAAIDSWLAEATLLALQSEGISYETGVALASVMNVRSDGPLAASDTLPEIDLGGFDVPPSQLVASERAPSVVAARALREAQQRHLVELRAARGTELNIGAMGWREGGGDVAAVATLELVVPLFERGQRESSGAAATLARAEEQERRVSLDAHFDGLRAVHEVRHSEEILRVTEDQLLQAAERLAEAQRLRLEARETTVQDWVLARRGVLRARMEAVRARAACILARFRARELLTHTPHGSNLP